MFSEMADALGEETEVYYPVATVFRKPLYRMPPVPLPPTKDDTSTGYKRWTDNLTCRFMLADGSTREAACSSRPVPVGRRLPPVTPSPVTPDPVAAAAPATAPAAAGTTNYLPWILGGLGLLVVFGGGKGK